MKRSLIALIALIVMSFAAKAQTNSLTIDNQSNCEIFYKIYGTTAGSGCMMDYVEAGLSVISAGQNYFYANPTAIPLHNGPLTLSPGDNFTMVEFFSSNPAWGCGTLNKVQFSNCTGPSTGTFTVESFGCTSCPPGALTFTVTTAGTNTTITIN